MRPLFIALIVCFIALPATAQTAASKVDNVYLIPFATSGNMVELDVVNSGEIKAEDVTVKAIEVPEWIELATEELSLEAFEIGEERLASFTFSVDREATVGEEKNLTFEIRAGDTVIGMKEFKVQVEAPTEAALMQNYPNPFNPETTLGFELPVNSKVDLRVYDILGREVAILAKEDRVPGYHTIKWDASNYASGTYFYILKATGKDGNQMLMSEKMLLVK